MRVLNNVCGATAFEHVFRDKYFKTVHNNAVKRTIIITNRISSSKHSAAVLFVIVRFSYVIRILRFAQNVRAKLKKCTRHERPD